MTATPAPVLDPFLLGQLARSTDVHHQALVRAASPDFPAWVGHVHSASRCSRPIRLGGQMLTVEAATGRVLSSVNTASLPDGVIYKACGNRRETVCPACSAVYKRDAFQIIRSLLVGGDGVPESVASHPGVFATLTAPSFGEVHTRIVARHTCDRRQHCACRPEPCHARRDAPRCPHGRPMVCYARHAPGDRALGSALCSDCYAYDDQAIWNLEVPELWRRTAGVAIGRYLDRLCRARGIPFPQILGPDGKWRRKSPVRLAYGKAGEYQRRGVIHLHALIRLDGFDPTDPDVIVPPPAGIGAVDLVDAIRYAATVTAYTTRPHPARPQGWVIGWGREVDARPIRVDADGPVTDVMVAAYIAKYATKSTEVTGHVSGRLDAETIDLYADPDGSHIERLIDACWQLGQPREWRRLRKAAHMLGFAGHILTKSRRHKVTFRVLRNRRTVYTRTVTAPATGPAGDSQTVPEQPTTLVVNFLEFVGAGWRNQADATLAATSASLARAYQAAAQAELAALAC